MVGDPGYDSCLVYKGVIVCQEQKMYYVLNQFYIARRTKSSSFIHVRPGIHSFTHIRSALKKVYKYIHARKKS